MSGRNPELRVRSGSGLTPASPTPTTKVKIKWTSNLSVGGRFQEKGSKSDPSKRSLTLWVHRKFPGVLRENGVAMFAHHGKVPMCDVSSEWCGSAYVRAIEVGAGARGSGWSH